MYQYVYNPALDTPDKTGWDHDMAALAAFGYEPASDEPECILRGGREKYSLKPISLNLLAGQVLSPMGTEPTVGADTMVRDLLDEALDNLVITR